MKKNKFLTFLFSLCPGVGHLYLALFKQGVELMILFFGVISLTFTLEITQLGFLLPIIWFYSMFDALNKCSMDYAEDSHLELFQFMDFDNIFSKSNTKYIGIGLVVLGVLSIINGLLPSVLRMFFANLDTYLFMKTFRTALLSLILIFAGIKLFKKAIYPTEKRDAL